MKKSVRIINSLLDKEKIEALLVTNPVSVEYLTEFKGDAVLLIIPQKANFIITDLRFIQEASLIKDFKVEIVKQKLPLFLSKKIKNFKLKRIGFEKNGITYAQYSLLKEACEEIELIPTSFIEEMRIIKDEEEINHIKEAIKIAVSAFELLFFKLKIGDTEREIAHYLEYMLRKEGAEAIAFQPIVAAGYNASCPHAIPSSKKWMINEPLLIDWGAKIKGYNCDLTRMVFSYKINHIYKEYYEILISAQQKVFSFIKPGIEAKELDLLIRKYFKKYKLDKFLLHSAGHGIGREVHEAPWISKDNNFIIKENMIFTIEPAIYMKGKYGLRIEDMIRVTPKGCEILSSKLKKWYIKK